MARLAATAGEREVGPTMAMRTLILIGTRKGAFTLELDAERQKGSLRGPFGEAMPMQHVAWDGVTRCHPRRCRLALVWPRRVAE